jgi:SAM-dependent methyltransferase
MEETGEFSMVVPMSEIDMSLMLSLSKELDYPDGYHYADFICKYPFSFYLERVKRINFVGKESIIDVGCGFGQWSAAFALQNRHVVALEIHSPRLMVARTVARRFGIHNVDFVLGNALSLPIDDATCDGVFCYGVMMFLDRQKVLQEFYRVLKPGGEMYICTNAFGWWLKLWLQHLCGDRNVRSAAFAAMKSGGRGGLPNSTSIQAVRRLLPPEQWEYIAAAPEGTISRYADGHVRQPLPCYAGAFLGFDAVIEFMAQKR